MHLASSFGWTLDQCRNVTLEELLHIYKFQNKVPPLYILAASYLGAIKNKVEEVDESIDISEEEMKNNLKKLREKQKNKAKNGG